MTKSKAETLADALQWYDASVTECVPVLMRAAAHLRTQDALIRELVEALKLATAFKEGGTQVAREALAKAEAAR